MGTAVRTEPRRVRQVTAACLIFFTLIASWPFTIVPPGYLGVVTVLGSTWSVPLRSGPHVVWPFLSRVVMISTKTELLENSNTVPTAEGLNVELDVSLLYHLHADNVVSMFIHVGPNVAEKLIMPTMRSAVRGITSESSAKALYSSGREKVRKDLLMELQTKLEPRGVVVEDVMLRNLQLPEQLTKSIELKLSTEQESQRMEFVLRREEQEAERKRIEAKGVRDFQAIVSEGISPELLRWKGIEATEKLAESRNSKMVVIGGGADGLPIILGGAPDSAPAPEDEPAQHAPAARGRPSSPSAADQHLLRGARAPDAAELTGRIAPE